MLLLLKRRRIKDVIELELSHCDDIKYKCHNLCYCNTVLEKVQLSKFDYVFAKEINNV